MPSIRFAPRRAALLALAVHVAAVPAGRAGAQDGFDDEFGDEFGEEDDAAPAPAPAPARRPAGGQDEFGDEFGDELGDEGEEEAAPAPAPARRADTVDDADAPFGDPADDGPAVSGAPAVPAVPGAIAPEVRAARARALRVHNTIGGPVGGLRVVDAGGGAAGAFRLQLAVEYFTAGDFLVEGDTNQRIGGTLSLSWTPFEFLELYASVYAGANSNDRQDPRLVQVLGDTWVGAKGFVRLLPWLTVGGDFAVAFLNTVGDIGVVLESTSFGLRANASVDLREIASPFPLVARLNLRYFFDRSEQLIEQVEQDRYAALLDPAPFPDETRNLITRVERFALNINRTDFFDVQVGFEAPITVTDDFFVHPILEWNLRVPVNRQGYDCLDTRDDFGALPPGDDGCLDIVGFSAFPQTITAGVRVLPPVPGLSAFVGVDVGVTGVNDDVRELAATAPWNLLFGASYVVDATPLPPDPIVRVVEQETEVPVEEPMGRLEGTVVARGTNTPIEGAVVRFPGRELTALYTAPDGTFTSYELEPGEVALDVSHPDHQSASCGATIPPAGGDVPVRCELVPEPRATSLRVRVVGEGGAPIGAARVELSGPTSKTATTGGDGTVEIADLQPGTYRAQVEAERYLIRVVPTVDVRLGAVTQLEVTLLEKPPQPTVIPRQGSIVLRRRINFATDSAEILPSSENLLNEIADVLIRYPAIRRVEIQGHTDDRGGDEFNMRLSQRRAEAVRDRLIQLGVDAVRLDARGYGLTRPLVPNITAANRARNRRVQFIIRERAE